ncbi:unnamed protein product, partial [Lepidochelys kempii]
ARVSCTISAWDLESNLSSWWTPLSPSNTEEQQDVVIAFSMLVSLGIAILDQIRWPSIPSLLVTTAQPHWSTFLFTKPGVTPLNMLNESYLTTSRVVLEYLHS